MIKIIIPAYNPPPIELRNLVDKLNQFGAILIVNDGSDSVYAQQFSELVQYPNVEVIESPSNRGKGAAIKTAIEFLRDSNPQLRGIITVDADGQHDPKDVRKLFTRACKLSDSVIIGERRFPKRTPFRSKFGNKLTATIFKLAFNISLNDTQTGLRYYPARIFDDILNIPQNRYDFETRVLIKICRANNPQIISIAGIYKDGNKSSHFRKIRDSLLIYKVILGYATSGLVGYFLDFLIFITLIFIGVDAILSALIARILSGSANFILNRNLVFEDRNSKVSRQLVSYGLLAVFSSIVAGGIASFLAQSQMSIIFYKVIADGLIFSFNFYVQSKFIFRERR